jgi:predicted Zn-dependent peptidase
MANTNSDISNDAIASSARRVGPRAVFCTLFVVLTLGWGPSADDLERVRLPFVEERLSNGLTVLVHEDHRIPAVSVEVWYEVGSSVDPSGRSGFAHLFEHLMLQGSRHVPEDMYYKLLEQAGATDRNANTGDDFTRYFETVPSNELELALWLESDRMAFFLDRLDEKTFDNQRDVVKNERRQTYEDRRCGFCWNFLRQNVFPPDHPYHRPIIGTAEDLDAATLDAARAFFRTWYVPNNAAIAIAGDVDPKVALALVSKYFGPIVARSLPSRPEVPPVRLAGERRVDVAAGVDLAEVDIAWPTPALFHDGDGELELLANVLAGGESSRLYRRLVHDFALAESVWAGQDSARLGSMFVVIASVRSGHAPEDVLRVIDEELRGIADSGMTNNELARAYGRIMAAKVFSLERGLNRADRLDQYLLEAGDANYLARDLARYQLATPSTVRRVLLDYLPPGRRVVQIVRPTKGAALAGEIRGCRETGSDP